MFVFFCHFTAVMFVNLKCQVDVDDRTALLEPLGSNRASGALLVWRSLGKQNTLLQRSRDICPLPNGPSASCLPRSNCDGAVCRLVLCQDRIISEAFRLLTAILLHKNAPPLETIPLPFAVLDSEILCLALDRSFAVSLIKSVWSLML